MNPDPWTTDLTDTNLSVTKPVAQSDPRHKWLSVLDSANQIARAADLEDMLAQMLDLMIEASQGESAIFYLFDPCTDELVVTSVRGDQESLGLIGLRLKRQLGVVGTAVSSSQPIIVGDLLSDPRWLRAIDPERSSHLRNAITLPLAIDDRLFGAIQIFQYQQAELDLLRVLGDRFAIEIERKISSAATLESNQRLRAVIDIIGQLAETMDRDRLLHLVTEHAARLVGAERSSIFLVGKDSNDLAYQVSYRLQDEEIDLPDKLSQQPNIIKLAGNLITQMPRQGSTRQSGALGFATRSAISVPLQSGPIGAKLEGHNTERIFGGLMALNKRGANFNDEDVQLLNILADQTSAFLQIAESYENANDIFLDALKALVAAIDAKDPYTQGHSLRVSEYSVAIAEELALDDEAINAIRIGSLVHDVGKIGIPDQILKKKGRLEKEENAEIRMHPDIGSAIMGQVRVLHDVLPAISEHHERLNGSGYPHGLRGVQISLMGRIVAVADVFDAMTSNRPYRPAIDTESVLTYLQENSGTLFDPNCVEALLKIIQGEKT